MKILIIHPKLTIGGAEKVILLLAENLRKLGIKVCLFFSEADAKALDILRIKTKDNLIIQSIDKSQSITNENVFFKSIEYLKDASKLYLFVKKAYDAYDIINPHNFPAYWSIIAANNMIPIIWTCHDVLEPYGVFRDYYDRSLLMKLITKLSFKLDFQIVRKHITKIVTNSKKNAKLIAKRYGKQSEVIYPPINFEIYNRRRINDKLVTGDFVMLQVGSLVKLKNQAISILALKIIKKYIPKSKLIILGNGPWKNWLTYLINDLKLNKDVVFMDYVDEENLAKIYSSCDLYLNPVLEQSFGLTPFEALASETPVIISKKCGAAEIINRYAPEMVIEPKTKTLAEKILEIHKNYDNFLDKTKTLKLIIIEELSPIKYTEKMLKVIKKVLEKS